MLCLEVPSESTSFMGFCGHPGYTSDTGILAHIMSFSCFILTTLSTDGPQIENLDIDLKYVHTDLKRGPVVGYGRSVLEVLINFMFHISVWVPGLLKCLPWTRSKVTVQVTN